jgi:hypothetical protein
MLSIFMSLLLNRFLFGNLNQINKRLKFGAQTIEGFSKTMTTIITNEISLQFLCYKQMII